MSEIIVELRRFIWGSVLTKRELVETAVDALEIGKTGQQLRFSTGGAVARWTDETSRAGANAFNRLIAEAHLLNVDSRGEILSHRMSSLRALRRTNSTDQQG